MTRLDPTPAYKGPSYVESLNGLTHQLRTGDNELTLCGKVLVNGRRLNLAPRVNRCTACRRLQMWRAKVAW